MNSMFSRQSMLTADMKMYLRQLIGLSPGLRQIWLFGSRANLTGRAESDWDYLAHGTANCLSEISALPDLHRQDVDFLVSSDGENFVNAWGDRNKLLDRVTLRWQQLSEDAAEYIGTKDVLGEFRFKQTKCMAFRIWHRE
jgi:hypothetical protein